MHDIENNMSTDWNCSGFIEKKVFYFFLKYKYKFQNKTVLTLYVVRQEGDARFEYAI